MLKFSMIAAKTKPIQRPLLQSSEMQDQWRSCESIAAVFSTASLIFATIDYEIRYSPQRNNDNCAMAEDTTDVFRWIVVFLTITTGLFVVQRYSVKRSWLLLMTSNQAKDQLFIVDYKSWTYMSLMLLGELLILSLFPYPKLSDAEVHLNERNMISQTDNQVFTQAPMCFRLSEILYSLMFIRVFFVFRALLNYSGFTNATARRICIRLGVKPGLEFNIRAAAKRSPHIFILATFVLSCIVFAILIRIYERPYVIISQCDFDSVLNSAWFSLSTLYTAPYGDYYPQTYIGRTAAFFLCVEALFLMSVAYTLMSDWMDFSTSEEEAYENIKATRYAATVIEAGFLYYLARKRYSNRHIKTQSARSQLWKAAENFAYQLPRLSRQIGLSEHQQSEKYKRLQDIDYLLWKIDGKLSLSLTKLEDNLTNVAVLLHKLEVLNQSKQVVL